MGVVVKADLDAELREAYLRSISAKEGEQVTVSADAFKRLYRMAYFHIPIPKFVTRIRERLT